jgi:pimeloyl-[acyl-carrier protein] methyl ester esterase
MGAQVALQACAALTGKLAGMVLVSATPRFAASDDFPHALADSEAFGMCLKVQRNLGRALEGFYSRLFAEGELQNHPYASDIKALLSSIIPPEATTALEALDALVQTDMRHLLAAITIPTLIMNGAMDQICLPQASIYLREQILRTEHVVFEQTGHAPFLTSAVQFNTEIIRFARSVCEQVPRLH